MPSLKTESRQKTIIYKKAQFTQADGCTLQEYLNSALASSEKIADRSEAIGELNRVIGKHKTQEDVLFGELVLFERDKNLEFIIENEKEIEIESISASEAHIGDDDKKREVLEGCLHFCVKDDHLIIAQSHSVRSSLLEAHLNWLLSEKTKSMTGVVALIDEPTQEAKELLEGSPVKSARITNPIVVSEADDKVAHVGTSTSQPAVQQVKVKRPGLGIVKLIMGEDWHEDLEQDLDDANLNVTVTVKYNRKTNDKGHAFIDHFASVTRHQDPEHALITLEDKSTIKGSKMMLRRSVDVDYINGVVDRSGLYTQMKAWLISLIETVLDK